MLLLSIEMVFNSNDWEEHFVLPDDLQSKSACKCMVVLVARLRTVVLESYQRINSNTGTWEFVDFQGFFQFWGHFLQSKHNGFHSNKCFCSSLMHK